LGSGIATRGPAPVVERLVNKGKIFQEGQKNSDSAFSLGAARREGGGKLFSVHRHGRRHDIRACRRALHPSLPEEAQNQSNKKRGMRRERGGSQQSRGWDGKSEGKKAVFGHHNRQNQFITWEAPPNQQRENDVSLPQIKGKSGLVKKRLRAWNKKRLEQRSY